MTAFDINNRTPTTPVAVEGPHGPIRLKWHKLRRQPTQAPFIRSNLALGWQLGASLEIDMLATADDRFAVLHDPTLGPSTTGRGHVSRTPIASMSGLFHRDADGDPDPDAPVLSLAELVAPLRRLPRAPSANLQLDLKLLERHAVPDSAVADAAAAVAGLADAIVVGSHHLDEARRLVAAIPGARLGYDPMLAVSRQPALRDPERLLRHMERHRTGVSLAYLRFDAIVAAETQGFPLVQRLLDLGIETDAWTVNPGPAISDATLRTLVEAKVRQITTDAPSEIFRLIRSC
ncbi:glycerophosphoryl diester phosphodiesterase [Sinorhizobium terangae]|uniref:glycerophosphodiester phosphodiesterase n=1 Tax=Sinorhizobium terangae TaxID=110322 RepID=UPI0017B2EF6C|nr:glycerophosphodiester phosphodiesterase family protein [Sinorhizobium terangae]MBB4187248.1 glycerophosphoryl diester phosphodiesterase [Sinorhizobium terangae]